MSAEESGPTIANAIIGAEATGLRKTIKQLNAVVAGKDRELKTLKEENERLKLRVKSMTEAVIGKSAAQVTKKSLKVEHGEAVVIRLSRLKVFLSDSIWPRIKWLPKDWRKYVAAASDREAACQVFLRQFAVEENEVEQVMWATVLVPYVNSFMINNRNNTVKAFKKLFYGEFDCFACCVLPSPLTFDHCVCYISEDFAAKSTFDHLISEEDLATKEAITKLDKEWVRENYMTVDFCRFVYKYAAVVSRTATDLKKFLLEEDDWADNLFGELSASDIAWALTQYVNNVDYWEADIKSKASEGAAKPRTSKRRKKDDAAAAEAGATDGDEGSSPSKKGAKQQNRWAENAKKKVGEPFNNMGVHFYKVVLHAFYEIDNDEWKPVWSAFWAQQLLEEKESPLKRRKIDYDKGVPSLPPLDNHLMMCDLTLNLDGDDDEDLGSDLDSSASNGTSSIE